MNKSYLVICTALLSLAAPTLLLAEPPTVTNVVASQRAGTKLVDIHYDVNDPDGDLLKVRVEVSDNDGTLYSVPAFSMTGDIGEGIASGIGKHIVWDAGVDWDGEYSDKMRVKVFAVDAKGFPGMEWGNEVPPGGFLMGQDGGVEGSGPSRHVNIPWSYWLSKYEITIGQYCDFLNAALVAGFVTRSDTTAVYSKSDALLFQGLQGTFQLITLGDGYDIRWNVNNFEPVNSRTNFPVCVTWHGALAFSHFYGYDLPSEAEWEKAARGPDHDDQDEHYVYTWGNSLAGGYANYNGSGDPWSSSGTSPVGYYNGNQTPLGPDTSNGYGLYDMVGNLSEWTLALSGYAVETYPQQESIWSTNNVLISSSSRVSKGGSYGMSSGASHLKLYYRSGQTPTTQSYTGFRAARRNGDAQRSFAKCEVFENFDAWPVLGGSGITWTNTTSSGNWISESGYVYVKNDTFNASSGSNYLYNPGYGVNLYLPQLTNQIVMVRAKVKNPSSSWHSITLGYVSASGSSSVSIDAYTTSYQTVVLPVTLQGKACYLYFPNLYVDDIELWTVPAGQ